MSTPPPVTSPAPTPPPPPPPGNTTAPPPTTTSPPPPLPTTPPPDSSPPPPIPPTSSPPPPPDTPSPATSPPAPPPPTGSNSPPAPPTSRNSPPSPSGRSPPSPPAPRGGSTVPPATPSDDSTGISTGVVVGIAVGGVLILVVLSILFLCCRKKRKRNQAPAGYYVPPPPPPPKVDPYGGPPQQWQQNAPPPTDHHITMPPPNPNPPPPVASRPPQPFISSSGGSGGSGSNYSGGSNSLPPPSPGLSLGFSKSTFSYEELAMATDGFSEANLLGQGGFGYVHRGVLPNGKEVAVKQLKTGSGQGEREFQAEVEIISRVHHKHLVSLVGYCTTGAQRLLVYEFVPNNTLEFHLHGKNRPVMEFPTRLKIALGAASPPFLSSLRRPKAVVDPSPDNHTSSKTLSHTSRSNILIPSSNHIFNSPFINASSFDLVPFIVMASKISSRSRVNTPNKSNIKETGPKLEENLVIFKSDKFDADAFVNSKCNSLNEKEIRQLCSYLLDLKKASAEEMRRSVYANYTAFIRTSKEISDLEGELLSIRNLLSTQATLIHGLADGIHVESLSVTVPGGSLSNGVSADMDRDPSDLENWLIELPDILDVLLAERRIEEALATLDEGEHVASEAKRKQSLSPAVLASLQTAITECRQRLANQLADAASQPTTRGGELRAAISALKKLGDGPRAHSLLLQAHSHRLQSDMQNLRPSSTSYGGAYTAAISQLVFSVIAQTATDANAIFGNEPTYSSELVMWATKQTEDFALLVKRHALASSAAAGGLRAAAECVQIALGHCSLLEARGLTLCPVLLRLFRPSVEQALDANLKRIEESTAALAAADDWDLSSSPTVTRLSGRPSSTSLNTITHQHKLSSSAQRFNSMVQDFFEDVGPLLSMQLGGKMLEGLFHVFNSYVSMLIRALPGSMEEEANYEGSGNKIVRMAETESQQMALLANASLLADELLPRAAMKLTPVMYNDDPRGRPSDRQNRNPEQREWKRRLASIVDRLKDSFCRQHALALIFTEDGDTHLASEMYINMDESVEEIEWFPSPIFQELYAKLYRMSAIAAEMFAGRERFSTLLLMKLTETVILWLSKDQTFWEDILEGPRPLGPLGLQQFYLDMQFVLSFASQGRSSSRNLKRTVNEIVNKALAAFSATGMDPYSVLPEDEWFDDICQDAMDRLSGKPRLANGERDLSSPTASVSAQSISSVRSHGSS